MKIVLAIFIDNWVNSIINRSSKIIYRYMTNGKPNDAPKLFYSQLVNQLTTNVVVDK